MSRMISLLCAFVLLPSILHSQEPDIESLETTKTDSTVTESTESDRFKFAAIPVINYDPAFKWNLAGLVNAFFKVSLADTISPLSMAGAMVGYTTNGTWYWALYSKLYFNKDNYRTTMAYGDASVNFQYFDELGGEFIDFNTLHDFFLFEQQRRVYKRWYLGLRYRNQKAKTQFEIEGQPGDPQKRNMNNLGAVVSHDTRDFIYNPYHGDYMNFKTARYRDALGSDFIFDQYEFDFTKFFNINDHKVVAGRVAAFIATGDVPFEGQYVVGREDIRGYTNGKHRANQVYDVQAEYRWNVYKKWGMVAFGGIATAVDSPKDITFSGLLPGAGAGVRFMAVPSEKINIGMDVAFGKDDWGIYFRQAMLKDARQRTLDLILDLDDDQLMGPKLDIVNPLLWEIGHVAFFHEIFVLRELGATDRLLEGAEELYDSFQVAHELRWDLLLPDREKTLSYAQTVMDRMMERLESHAPTPQETYLYLLAVFHEDMHAEAFTWTRQTLEYPTPRYAKRDESDGSRGTRSSGDVEIPGGVYQLGAEPHQPFVFDNEKWCHDVVLAPFSIARTAVTNQQFADFVEDGGYDRPDLWSYSGRTWLEQNGPKHPVYWQKENGNWMQRHFDAMLPMRDYDPVIHVNWYEAEAYCKWAGRRLPTEVEWEMVASMASGAKGKPMYAWGDEAPAAEHANLDGAAMGCVDVSACAEGDSASGCRQMIGNVWEWTSSAFYPFPGYIVDRPYREYSAPWFGYNKVLRGGCWATRSRLIRDTYRNFALPHRRDVFAGFRTCTSLA